MREIKNNVEIAKVARQDIRFSGAEKPEAQTAEVKPQEKEIKDFSNPSAEVLGRSQVKAAKTDNVKEDTKFAVKNPEAIENSDKIFEAAYEKLKAEGDPQAYEKAAAIATSEEAKELLTK